MAIGSAWVFEFRVSGFSPLALGWTFLNGSENDTVVPTPGLLSSQIRPCMTFSMMALQIERPRPVPPYERAVLESACENGKKRFFCCSSEMPIPVSATDMIA